MSRLTAFLRLIRYKNLLIVAFTQYVIRLSLSKPFLESTALTDTHFFLFVITTILIMASGYIINDIYDLQTDLINEKDNVIISYEIERVSAIKLYILFNLLALISAVYLSIYINKPFYSLVFLYSIFMLWLYSKRMKILFFIGNFHIAILTSLVLVNTMLFDILPVVQNQLNDIVSASMLVRIVLIYSLFSFLLTLSRELIKDLEDKEGDQIINAKTVPIVLGGSRTKIITSCLIFLTIIIIGYWQYFQYQILSLRGVVWEESIYNSVHIWGTDKYAVIYTLFLQILLIYLIFKLFFAKTKRELFMVSQFNKIIMVLGICSMPLFSFFYLN